MRQNVLVNAGLTDELRAFRQQFGVATPGDVVMAGIGANEDAVFDVVQNKFANDPRATDRQFRNTGFAR
jgi:hypothetical protein